LTPLFETVQVLDCGLSMSTTLSPRAVLLTMLFIVVSMVCHATLHCIQLLHA